MSPPSHRDLRAFEIADTTDKVLSESIEKFYRSCGTGIDEVLDLGDPALKFECPWRLRAKTLQELLKDSTLTEDGVHLICGFGSIRQHGMTFRFNWMSRSRVVRGRELRSRERGS